MTEDGRPTTDAQRSVLGHSSSVSYRNVNNLLARLKSHPQLFAYATVLVAFFLRAYRLADKNVWWDEGWSVWLSQKDLAWIAFRTAADEHPPLHYWLLHFWNLIAGTEAFTGRFVSLFFGVLTIVLLYRIGKRVGGKWIGVLAALFLAIARFHIWWSQDIKNYTLSIFFAFAALWFGLEILGKPEFRIQNSESATRNSQFVIRYAIVGYALCAALAIWTHYLAALVLIALNICALLEIAHRWLTADRRPLPHSLTPTQLFNWLMANILAVTLFAPWLYLYLQNASSWSAAPSFDFLLFLKLVATVLPLGVTTNIDNYAILTITFTVLAALSAFWFFAPRNSQPAIRNHESRITFHVLLFILIILFPPLLIYLLSLTPVSFFAPKIQARYLLILLPAYVMLLAFGIAFLSRLSRSFAAFALLIVLAASAFVLNDYYADRRLTDEYSTLANTINSFARQGDLVLLDTDQEWPTFLYYLRAPLDWLGVPNGKPMTTDDADILVKRALSHNRAIWLVTIPDALATDPMKLLQSRIARELPFRSDLASSYGDKQLFLFTRDKRDLVQVEEANLQIQHSLPSVSLTNLTNPQQKFQLLGFDLPVREVRAGDSIPLTTYWDATSSIKAELQFVDSKERIVLAPEIYVSAGKNVRVPGGGILPPDAQGDYTLNIRVETQTIGLAHVSVIPTGGQRYDSALFGSMQNAHPMDYRIGDSIHLLGFNELAKEFRAGESVPLGLIWRTDRPVDKSYKVFIHLLGMEWNASQNNFLWGQVDRVPREGLYPTSAWRPGDRIVDINGVVIDLHAPTGSYKIEVGLYDPATGERLPVSGGGDSVVIGEIQVVAR